MLLLLTAISTLTGCAGKPTPSETDSPGADTHVDSPDSHDSPDSAPDDSDSTPDTHDTAPPVPAHVVLFIGDGMGLEQVAGAGMFATGAAGTLGLEALPVHGTLRTASLSGITDSAASGTSMSTGTKTWNGHLGLDRDGNTLENVREVAEARGMATGIVTTDRIAGATPSSFLVHTEDRYSYAEISALIAADLPDVALAGGTIDMEGLLDTEAVDLVTTATELAAWTPGGKPLVGLFASSMFPYVYDGYGEAPSLADMTTTAINALMADPDGFFLMVEGARIDHASHADDATRVFPETIAFDEAITAAMAILPSDATVVVTADHECGGLHVISGNGAGVTPSVEWRYNWHTNTDVGVWGSGPYTETFDGQRLDNSWVHAVLDAAVRQADVVPPDEVPLVDGYLTDLPDAVVTQPWTSSFDASYNRLDALHVTSDADGLRIGIDGVFEDDANAVLVYIDIDYGDSTGWPHDDALTDFEGGSDKAISNARITFADPTFGAERVLLSLQAEEAFQNQPAGDTSGLRDVTAEADFGWLQSGINFDSGNVSLFDAPAADAGVTDEGFEAQVLWTTLYGTDTPTVDRRLAVVAVLVNDQGTWISNQALPPFESDIEAGGGTATLVSEVEIDVAGDGSLLGTPVVTP